MVSEDNDMAWATVAGYYAAAMVFILPLILSDLIPTVAGMIAAVPIAYWMSRH